MNVEKIVEVAQRVVEAENNQPEPVSDELKRLLLHLPGRDFTLVQIASKLLAGKSYQLRSHLPEHIEEVRLLAQHLGAKEEEVPRPAEVFENLIDHNEVTALLFRASK